MRSVLKSTIIYTVFWPILILLYGWSPLIFLNSKSSNPCINPLVIVPRPPITIGITVTFMFHRFFQFPTKVQVLILLFTFFQLYFVVSRNSKVYNSANSLFLLFLIINRYDRLAEIRWSVYIFKSQRSLCVSSSTMDSELCIYHLFLWSNYIITF